MGSFIVFGGSSEERLQEARRRSENLSSGVDLILLEEAKGIEAVREIISTLSRKPYQSKSISVVLTEADRLTVEAQNALLKTLEEPLGESNIFLLSQNPEELLPTVRSRAQMINLGPSQANVSTRDLKSAWTLYQNGNLASIFETSGEAKVEAWAELGRQLLLYIMGGQELMEKTTFGPKLTEFATTEEMGKITEDLNPASLHKFLSATQQAKSDLAANANRKLVLENLFLYLPLKP